MAWLRHTMSIAGHQCDTLGLSHSHMRHTGHVVCSCYDTLGVSHSVFCDTPGVSQQVDATRLSCR